MIETNQYAPPLQHTDTKEALSIQYGTISERHSTRQPNMNKPHAEVDFYLVSIYNVIQKFHSSTECK